LLANLGESPARCVVVPFRKRMLNFLKIVSQQNEILGFIELFKFKQQIGCYCEWNGQDKESPKLL
jgi:hypothetical protein